MNKLLGRFHRRAARWPLLVRLALLLRNQANCIIARYLGESSDARLNGEELLASTLASHCVSFADVGANAGSWTEMWLRYCGPEYRGFLFEPLPSQYRKLKGKFGEKKHLQIMNIAAGDEDGELPFFIDETFDETSSLLAPAADHKVRTASVRVCRLDTELPRLGCDRLDFLKIDAEGFDARVLKGAASLLVSSSIRAIQFEYNTSWAAAGSTLTDTINFLSRFGYDTFLMRSDGLHRFDVSTFGEYFRYSNFFATNDTTDLAVGKLLR
jgi:FkbM family methyltransferase